jgi:triphosphoribosyl-dephospho-CoA synthase
MLHAGLCAQFACIAEVTARKPGNVHRYADFADVTYVDFLLSAAMVAPIFGLAHLQGVGQTILQAVQATRKVVKTNTNLGIILLLAPLAAVPPSERLQEGVQRVLNRLDANDAKRVYQAIRLARPGGLGTVPDQDVATEPTQTLRQVMALAKDRDLIARQYVNGFRQVFQDGVPALTAALEKSAFLEQAIISSYLHLLAEHPDSLIARKRGQAEANEASHRAGQVLRAGWPDSAAGRTALAEFDTWLRAEGHQRNPGTTADLITACLFVLLREGTIQLPPQFPWFAGADHAAEL